MRAAIVTFPGSNREPDLETALRGAGCRRLHRVWHDDTSLPSVDLICLPGGFAHGDYLRCGAIAARAPVVAEIVKRAAAGVAVLGICNGFQILAEAGLVPGALISNAGLKFVCRKVSLEVATTASVFTAGYELKQTITLPVAHHDGNYVLTPGELRALEDQDRIAFRYLDNPNGSTGAIAGVLGPGRNVLGIMPHPERAADPRLGGTDGRALFDALIERLG
jgi:phosphoribosylformylglycinamidine synthase subunit PurQ / glutaminase